MRDTDIRVGKVSSINYENGMLRVTYPDKGQSVTKNLPYANFNNEYKMPEVGSSVLVAHMSNGTSRGVVIGNMWNEKNVPAECGKGLYRKELSQAKGMAVQRYDDASESYLLKAPKIRINSRKDMELKSKNLNINTSESVSVDVEKCAFSAREVIVGITDSGSVPEIQIQNHSDINIQSDENVLETLLKSMVIKILEELQVKAAQDITLSTEAELLLEDGSWHTSLSKIMGRLEALDGDNSEKK